jgi:hypothetical protein
LQLGGFDFDLFQDFRVVGRVVNDALVQVISQQDAYLDSISGRQSIQSKVLCADGASFLLFVIFTLIVTAGGQREREADDQTQKRKARSKEEREIAFIWPALGRQFAKEFTDAANEPEECQSDCEKYKRMVQQKSHRAE